MTEPKKSLPGKPSKEADRKQLRVAQGEGDAVKRSLAAMRHETGRGKSIRVRDMLISCSEEHAEGLYIWEGDQLVWHNPSENENAHLEIVVEDAHDGRFIPYLDVTASIFKAAQDEPLLTVTLPFLWHPWLYHYGANLAMPGDGNYDLLIQVSNLKVNRHDKENGNRYTQPAEVRFENIPFTTGQKLN